MAEQCCAAFSSRVAVQKKYNENHICIFQYSNHIKNEKKLVILILLLYFNFKHDTSKTSLF